MFPISLKTISWSIFWALVISLLIWPIGYYLFFSQSLPIEVELAAPGTEIVKAYWKNPKTHPNDYESIFVKPVESKKWNIKIEALGEKNPQSQGYEIVILDLKTIQRQVDWSKAILQGNWELRDSPGSPQNKAAIAYSNQPQYELHFGEIQSLEVPIVGGDLEIELFGHGGAGKVRITANDRVRELDLFNQEGFHQTLHFPAFSRGDRRFRTYILNASIPHWSKLRFLAEAGEVNVREVRVAGQAIAAHQNNEYILPTDKPLRQSIRLSGTIFLIVFLMLFSILLGRKKTSHQRFYQAFSLTLPALIAVAIVQHNEVSFFDMMFTGGKNIAIENGCFSILLVYSAVFIFALGRFFSLSPSHLVYQNFPQGDINLLKFFNGAAILIFLGFVLGLAKLLTPIVTASVFISILYLYFFRFPNPFKALWSWLVMKEEQNPKEFLSSFTARYFSKTLQIISFALHLLFIGLVFHIAIARGIFLNIFPIGDVLQYYFSYFAEVRRLNGIWLNPNHPIIADFLAGRGNGVHLFFTSFTSEYFIQMIGVIYFVSIALLAYRVVLKFCHWCEPSTWRIFTIKIFPISASLFILTSSLQDAEMGKYHLQTGAFLLCIAFYCSHFILVDRAVGKWLLFSMTPIVMALAIAISPIAPIVLAVLVGSALMAYFTRGSLRRIFPYLILIAASLLTTLISLLFNQFYIGIAEVNPWHIFVKFANLEQFQQWSSIDQYVYLGLSQNHLPFEFSVLDILQFNFFDTEIYHLSLIFLGIVLVVNIIDYLFCRIKSKTKKQHPNNKFPEAKIKLSFIISLFFLYPVGIFFILYSSQNSALRLFEFLAFFNVIAFFGLLCLLLSQISRKVLCLERNKKIKSFLSIFSILILILIQLNDKIFVSPLTLSPSYKYALGQEGTIHLLGYLPPPLPLRLNFYRTLQIARILPDKGRLLLLNARAAQLPTQNSPLIPQGMVVPTYQSNMSPYYREILFGSPSNTYQILKSLNIDFFYIEKNYYDFFGPAYSNAFSRVNLMTHFDIFYETDNLIVLTWRGEGIRAVDSTTAFYIDKLREISKTREMSQLNELKTWLAFVKMKKQIQSDR